MRGAKEQVELKRLRETEMKYNILIRMLQVMQPINADKLLQVMNEQTASELQEVQHQLALPGQWTGCKAERSAG